MRSAISCFAAALPARRYILKFAAVVSAASAFTLQLRAADVTSTWNTGAGNWGDDGNWTNAPALGGFPNNGNSGVATYDAVLSNGGVITLDQNITIEKFTLSSGTLTGAFALTLNDILTWSGTMSGAGATTANGGILIDNAGPILTQRTLNNSSGNTATMSNTSYLSIGSGAILNNSGTFLAQVTQDGYGLFDNGGGGTFNNSGTFTRNVGTGTFQIATGIVFNNTGTTDVQTGILALQGGDGGSTTGDFNISAGATLRFQSNFDLAATADISGEGTVEFSSGTINLLNSTLPNVRISGATTSFNAPTTAASLTLTAGTLGGGVAFTSTGLFTWTGGTMNGSGTTTANGGILMDNAGPILTQRTLNNSSGNTATMSNTSYLYFGSGAVVNNSGTFLAQVTQDGYGLFDYGGGGTFNNSGTFTRNTGTGSFPIASGIVFNNTGTTNVQNGTLALQGGDTGSTIGDFNVSSGATLNFASNFNLAASADVAGAGIVDFSGGTVNINGSYNVTGASRFTGATANFSNTVTSLGTGPLEISSGVANLNANSLTVASINQTGGTLDGSGTITSTGLLTWTGGVMNGSGTTTANGGILMNNASVFLTQRTLNNSSGNTATMSNTSYLYFGSGAVVNNSGTFLAQVTQDGYGFFDYGGGGTFNNSGTFTRSVGTGAFSSSIVFNNTGTTNVQTGTLTLQGGDTGSTSGDFNVSSGATLNFASNFNLAASADVAGAGIVNFSAGTVNINGSYNITGASRFTGATANFNNTITSLGAGALEISSGVANFNANNLTVASINQTSGTLDGSGTITSTGLLTWTSGVMSGSGTTTANGGILMDNASPILTQRTLNNSSVSTATMSNTSYLYFGSGAVVNNSGTFLAQVTQDGYGFFDYGGGGTFNNSGTFTRNVGTGTFSISIGFNNTGTTRVETGKLDLQSTTVTQYASDSLTAGIWFVGAGAQLKLPASGNGVVTNAADITLSGTASVFTSAPSVAPLEDTLTSNNGALRILAGRNYTATNAFTTSGKLQLGGGTFSAPFLAVTGTGELFGFGTVAVRPTNSGLVRSVGGTLAFADGILGGSGTVQIDAGSILNLGGGASAGSNADYLIHNGNSAGSLNLGSKTFTASVDYTNANFGTGNTFDPRANVSGTGQILAANGTGQSVSGNVTGGGTATPAMTFGKVHVGTTNTLNYAVNNTGATGSNLRGAMQTSVNGGNVTDSRLSGAGVTAENFGPIAPTANTGNLAVVFTPGTTAGALTGQTIRLLNNFDNVADQTLSVGGSAYRYAAPSAHSPEPVPFGNFHVGDTAPSQGLTIGNTAANDGFSEALNASIGGATGGVTTNAGSFTLLVPGLSNIGSMAVGISTAAAGSKNGTATISLTSDGTGSSNLGQTSLTAQTVNVTGSVFRLAQASLPGGTTINFGTVHIGETQQHIAAVNNAAAADGFSESLDGGFSGFTGDVSGATGSFVELAAGASSNAPVVTLNTASTGAKSGTATLAFASNGAGTSGLASTPLSSQVLNVSGQVNNFAAAQVLLDSGAATLSGNGTAYTLNFGLRTIGQTLPQAALKLRNSATAPADALAGSFSASAPDFNLSGFANFSGIAAGQDLTNLLVALQTDALGNFSETVTVNPRSQNDSGYDGLLPAVTITLQGIVALPPTLRIINSGSNVVVSWPLAEQGWIPKTSTTVGGWATVSQSIVDTVAEHTVTIPRGTDAKRFFRLEKL